MNIRMALGAQPGQVLRMILGEVSVPFDVWRRSGTPGRGFLATRLRP